MKPEGTCVGVSLEYVRPQGQNIKLDGVEFINMGLLNHDSRVLTTRWLLEMWI